MNQLDTARQAIAQEIRDLAVRQAQLQKILDQLTGGTSGGGGRVQSAPKAVAAKALRRRGRPRKNPLPELASPSDVNATVELIEQAGKKGVKAIALAYQVKKAGLTKPEKQQLLDTQKVKMTGKGGAATYIYVG